MGCYAMARKNKTKTVKPLAFVGLVKRAKGIVKDEKLKSDVSSEFLQSIQPYLTKSGKLRKNISQKRIKELNKIIMDYKNSPYSSKKTIKAIQDKQYKTGLANNTWSSKDEHDKVINAFKEEYLRDMINNAQLTSTQVVMLAKDYPEVTTDQIITAIKKAQKKKKRNTPRIARSDFESSDANQLNLIDIQEALNEMGLN